MNFLKLTCRSLEGVEHPKEYVLVNFDNVSHFYKSEGMECTLILFTNNDTAEVEETTNEIMKKLKEE